MVAFVLAVTESVSNRLLDVEPHIKVSENFK